MSKLKEQLQWMWSNLFDPHLDISEVFFAQRQLFLLTSTIHPANLPLSYTSTRSIFVADERLAQTLRSIESIRGMVPNSLIILLENSKLSDQEFQLLRDAVDWVILFAQDNDACLLRDSPHKGAAEIYMLLKAVNLLRYFQYKRMFKLSGRYWLSERFSLQKFPKTKFGFLVSGGTHSTRLYSIPKELEAVYAKQLAKTLVAARRGATIEAEIMRGIPSEQIELLPSLGVSGFIGVTGKFIDE
jgi:hypothetical protein